MSELIEEMPEGFRMTEFGPLPVDWEVVRLGDVAKISSGGSAPQGDEYFKGDRPFIRVSHIDNENYVINEYDLINEKAIHEYRLKLFPKGTIVFPKSGATVYLEKRAMLPIDAYVVSHLCTVIADKSNVSQHFLFYMLRNLKLAKKKADGYPTLNISEIKQILIPLPPLAEQKKIAAVLSTVQEAKEKTEAVINAAKDLKKSMMKHLFTYGPVSPQEAENVPLKETEIGMIPEEWVVARLSDLVDVKGGKRLPKGHSFSSTPTPYPYIRVVDFSNWSVKTTELKYLTPDDREIIKKYIITHDDVYISIAGTIGLVGSIPPKLNKANLTENAARLIIRDPKRLDKLFLIGYLASKRGQYEISIRTSKTSQPKLALNRIKTIPAPLPPLPVQQKIASILSAIDEKIEAEEGVKKALEDLFKTLLHDLMTAKIRVNNLDLGLNPDLNSANPDLNQNSEVKL